MIEVNNLKVIIFDFDETMYYSSNIKEYYVNYIRQVFKALTNYSDEKIEDTMQEYGFKSDGKNRVSFGKNCEKFGVTKEQWNNYRIDNFFQIDYKNAEVANNDIYKKLSRYVNLYIVSNELEENIRIKAKSMNIELSHFKKICAPNKSNIEEYNSNKQEVYKNILEMENCGPQDAIVVGDRYNVDIKPMEELGGKGILIEKAKEINNLFCYKGENLWKICNL